MQRPSHGTRKGQKSNFGMAAAGGAARDAPLGSFLFGNVDDSGALDEDSFADAEVRDALQRLAASRDDALDGVLEGFLGDEGAPGTAHGDAPKVVPGGAAVDYSGIEEVAAEARAEDPLALRLTRDGRYIRHSAFFAPPGPRRRRLRALRIRRRRGGPRPLQWADDEHAELRGPPAAPRPKAALVVAQLAGGDSSGMTGRERGSAAALEAAGVRVVARTPHAAGLPRVFDVYAWEDNIAVDDESAAGVARRLCRMAPLFAAPTALLGGRADGRPGIRPALVPRSAAGRILNRLLLDGRWADAVAVDGRCALPRTSPELPLDDPFLLLEGAAPPQPPAVRRHKRVRYERIQLDRLNVSGDRASGGAGTPAAGASSSRSRLGRPRKAAEARPAASAALAPPAHSSLALRLAAPHFRTAWTPAAARQWHRPALAVAPGTRARVAASAVAPGAAPSLLPAVARTAAPAVLLEHSEEHPPLLLNAGMGATIATRPADGRAPPIVLGALRPDAAPLLGALAEVPPGGAHVACALFRAPLFAHAVPPGLLLLVRAHVKGAPAPTWHVRAPAALAVAGQTLPAADAMHPHSRRLNAFARARVQAAAYRMFRRDLRARAPPAGGASARPAAPTLRIQRLVDAFPQWSSATIRKWMRDYAEPVPRGAGPAGAWRLRDDAPALSEDELRALVSPETACAYEAMVAGEQRLVDVGLGPRAGPDAALAASVGVLPRTVAKKERAAADAAFEEWRTRLAPWSIAANCIAAAAGRLAVAIVGDGDPSGRGEALAMLRASPGGVPVSPESAAYRAEVARVFSRQADVLSARDPPSAEEPPAAPPRARPSRVLRITRTFSVPGGGSRAETQVVDDPRLVLAYLAARRAADRGPRRRPAASAKADARPASSQQSAGGAARPSAPKRPKKVAFLETLSPAGLAAFRSLQASLEAVHDAVFGKDPAAKPFLRPVSRTAYPAYHLLVAQPMDLGTIRARIRRGHYRRPAELLADYCLVRDNCVQYNREDHPFSAAIADLVAHAADALSAPDVRGAERAFCAAAGLPEEPSAPPSVSMADVLGV